MARHRNAPVWGAAAGAVLLVLAAAAAAWWWASDGVDIPIVDRAPTPIIAGSATMLTVHVSGAVAIPGLVTVTVDGRVADVVAAAGGALPNADLAALNLAAPVRDGERIVVPLAGDDGRSAGSIDDGRVRVNDADVVAMQALPGVGPVLAARIVAHRDDAGPFETPEDLLDVPGIGEQTLAGMRDVIAVP